MSGDVLPPRCATSRPSGYVTPLREGGSLPGLMEADDLGTYVVKYSGAGQGLPVLVAEVVSGELARGLGLPVPELVTVELDPALGASEPDQEVQDLLRRSPGLNLGMDFLPGALDLDPGAFPVDPGFAGRVLWFDALVGNVDRTWRNVNMLRWHGAPYLIDHGATLTFHHGWSGPEPPEVVAAGAARPYDASAHVLLRARARSRRGRRRARPAVTPAGARGGRARARPLAGRAGLRRPRPGARRLRRAPARPAGRPRRVVAAAREASRRPGGRRAAGSPRPARQIWRRP